MGADTSTVLHETSPRAFPVMFCTVNEEFAISARMAADVAFMHESGASRSFGPLVRPKNRATRKFCPG